MGTYDTKSGGPISPKDDTPVIFDEEGTVYDLIDGFIPGNDVDKIIGIIHDLCVKAYGRTRGKQAR